jgi:flagellar basal-body rod protein FlgG
MIRAFHTSATGMNAQQVLLDNTANNLANANTTGFKASQVEFQDVLYSTLVQPGSLAATGQQIPTGVQLGNGVRVAGTSRQFSPGAINNTGHDLDIAIEGNGFFQVLMPDGSFRYTRDGSFHLNSNGDLVTGDGQFVQPRLTFPQDVTSVTIGADGTVSITTAGSPNTSTTLGRLQVTRFVNPAGLSADGRNLFMETPASGTAQQFNPGENGTGTLRGKSLEASNVQVVAELVNLIQAQRTYEFNTKAIRVADQMLSDTNDLVR